jgi:hypothetical protein
MLISSEIEKQVWGLVLEVDAKRNCPYVYYIMAKFSCTANAADKFGIYLQPNAPTDEWYWLEVIVIYDNSYTSARKL